MKKRVRKYRQSALQYKQSKRAFLELHRLNAARIALVQREVDALRNGTRITLAAFLACVAAMILIGLTCQL